MQNDIDLDVTFKGITIFRVAKLTFTVIFGYKVGKAAADVATNFLYSCVSDICDKIDEKRKKEEPKEG